MPREIQSLADPSPKTQGAGYTSEGDGYKVKTWPKYR